jgi:hypothetical protein
MKSRSTNSNNGSTNNGSSNPLNEAKQITNSLKRIRKSMELGLNQADLAVSVLAEDGESISDTYNDHKYELKNALLHTKKNLNRVKNIEERERYSLFLSMLFFTSTVIYIIAKRFRLLSLMWLTIHGLFYSSNKNNNINNKNSSNVISLNKKLDINQPYQNIIKAKDINENDKYDSRFEEDIDFNAKEEARLSSLTEQAAEEEEQDEWRAEVLADEQAKQEALNVDDAAFEYDETDLIDSYSDEL